MEPSHEQHRAAHAQMGAAPTIPRHASGIACQIDIGNYNLFIDKVKCGELLVVEAPEGPPGDTIEHWMLHANFRSPSPVNTDISVQVCLVPGSLDLRDFVARNQQLPGVRYIISTCRLQR